MKVQELTDSTSPAGFLESLLVRFRFPSQGLTVCAVLIFCGTMIFSGVRMNTHLLDPYSESGRGWAMMDFQSAIYFPTLAMIDGVNPYDAKAFLGKYPSTTALSAYSPFSLVLHAPFCLLPFRTANHVFFLFSTLLLLPFAALTLHVCKIPTRVSNIALLATAILLSRPGHLSILLGQIVPEVAIGSILAIHFARTKPLLAATGLALAALKPTFGIPIAIFLIAQRYLKPVFLGGAISLVGAAIGAITIDLRTGVRWGFLESILTQHVRIQDVPGVPDVFWPWRIDATSAISKFFGVQPPPPTDIVVFFGVVFFVGALFIFFPRQQFSNGAAGLPGAIVFLATITCVYHSWQDATLLVVPLLSVLTARNQDWGRVRPLYRWFVAGLISIVFLNFAVTKTVTELIPLTSTSYRLLTSANGMGICLALVACIAIMVHQTTSLVDGESAKE